MILVILGTQDKEFPRLLKAVDKAIDKGIIKDKVVVQAGQTKYESKNMEIFDLLPAPEFDKLMDQADLIITHGGAGSILAAIKKHKKIIAAARLEKYKEHHNDHQKQIIGEFAKQGYLLELDNFDDLGKIIKKIDKFKPKRFVSNTQNMIKLIENYIENTNNTSWYNRYKEVILYLFFGACTTFINIITFYLLRVIGIELYISNTIAWLVAVLFAFVTNKHYVFEKKSNNRKELLKECLNFYWYRLLSFILLDMGTMFVMVSLLHANETLSKVVANILVIIFNYLASKLIIFKK
ncbi:MAG: GtrA family protein [Bacilli bacterium]|nr:GtrA family protein [Bacilli bacterium]